MRRTLFLFAALTFAASARTHGQSACAQLGVDCSHPHVDQAPKSDRQDGNEEYYARRQAINREREAEKQRTRDRKAQEQALAEANKLAAQAWAYMQKGDCGKALERYDRALKLTSFLQWSKNRTLCLAELRRYDEAYAQWEILINNRDTPDADVRAMRYAEWEIMYDKGYICPLPPIFNGTEGCHRRPDHRTLDTTYVPLPYIKGKTWTAKQVLSSGKFTVTTTDGHEWHSGEVNMTTLNLLDARIKTDKGTVVRFVLPDDTTFVLGPQSDITMDNFIYDPNESMSSMVISLAKGMFRFVSGKLSHPVSKSISFPPVGEFGSRGTDVEFEHDPTGKGTLSEGTDRWWICTYDGDVNVTSGQRYVVPIGQCFIRFDHPGSKLSIGLFPDYDDSPSAASATSITQKARLSVTDFWDSEIEPKVTGRQ